MKHEQQLKSDPKSKVSPATMKRLVISILFTARRDRKVMKNINYFRPDLKQFFTDNELKNVTT